MEEVCWKDTEEFTTWRGGKEAFQTRGGLKAKIVVHVLRKDKTEFQSLRLP